MRENVTSDLPKIRALSVRKRRKPYNGKRRKRKRPLASKKRVRLRKKRRRPSYSDIIYPEAVFPFNA